MKNKTELKDILNLYLGCDGINIEYGQKVKLYGFDIDEFSPKENDGFPIKTYHEHYGHQELSIDGFKPILRPLSDMNEKERTAIEELLGILNADNFVNAWINNNSYCISIHVMIEVVNCLRKMNFDMDNLIESGQAIDATTIEK